MNVSWRKIKLKLCECRVNRYECWRWLWWLYRDVVMIWQPRWREWWRTWRRGWRATSTRWWPPWRRPLLTIRCSWWFSLLATKFPPPFVVNRFEFATFITLIFNFLWSTTCVSFSVCYPFHFQFSSTSVKGLSEF